MFSRFTHYFNKKGIIAVFHSLFPDPVYFNQPDWEKLQSGNIPSSIFKKLVSRRILIRDPSQDEECINILRNGLANSDSLSILYLILTKNCNYQCSYCFQPERHIHSIDSVRNTQLMGKDVAKRGIDLFSEQLHRSFNKAGVQILLYGGEPLLNLKTLYFAVNYIESLVKVGALPKSTSVLVTTNGCLIDNEIAKFFFDHDVAVTVSIDGRAKENNQYRKALSGIDTFKKAMRAISLLKKNSVNLSLSITITPVNVVKMVDIVKWVKTLDISSICFNWVGGKSYSYFGTVMTKFNYDRKVSSGLIASYKMARKLGIYEDRVGRKVLSFVDRDFQYCDCGAIGNQLVIQPDGKIAFCHASEKYNFGSINDKEISVFNNISVAKWRNAVPINNSKCLLCPAISVCGYGCFHNVLEITSNLFSMDKSFCFFVKKLFEFLIWDLYEISKYKSIGKSL